MSIIDLENVNFQYKGSRDGSLNNINLHIEKGQTVLLCGASGYRIIIQVNSKVI